MQEGEIIVNSGLIINPNTPWPDCTPDGIISSKEGAVIGYFEENVHKIKDK